MKIKAVCEATGLTDRTVRYYIEEGLLSPKYTENYLGRKNYDFSQQDIKNLKKIALLRSYDFTVEEIHSIIHNSGSSQSIIRSVIHRTEKNLSDREEKIAYLKKLDTQKPYSFSDLAENLSNISYNASYQGEPAKPGIRKRIGSFLLRMVVFVIVWLPVAISALILLWIRTKFYFPDYSLKGVLCLLLCLSPSIGVLIVSRFQFPGRKAVKGILLALCILSIPFSGAYSALGVITGSKTENIRDYRDFDVRVDVNAVEEFSELFPQIAHTADWVILDDGRKERVPVDAKYYYQYKVDIDDTFDVYAQWPLPEAEFYDEVARVKKVFEENSAEDTSIRTQYVTVQKGNYTCLISYDTYGGNDPFETQTDNYSYWMFAYNEESRTVRYIYCWSLQNGTRQPYYSSLKWD